MRKILNAACLVLISIVGGIAQEHTENKSDQALRGSSRVNPSSLGMEITIPLGSYSGRGINVPISLSYSSKVWRMDYLYDAEGGGNSNPGCRSVNEAKYSESTASGWTTSLASPYVEYVGKNNIYSNRGLPFGIDNCVIAPPNYDTPALIRRLVVHLPSGETHEMRADDSVYPLVDMNDANAPFFWDATFYATDGSNIKYIENSATNTYRLLMPDGSFYDFSTSQSWGSQGWIRSAVKLTDRNGNHTNYDAVTRSWTDTLGRTLTEPFGTAAPSVGTQTYSMPGMTGTYKFKWKQLKGSSAAESALTDFNQDLKYRGRYINQTANANWAVRSAGTYLFNSEFEHYVLSGQEVFNPVVLAEIELPTGELYKFSYNIVGLIEKISYPAGGEEKFLYSSVLPLTPSPLNNVTDQTNFGVVNRKVYPVPDGSFYEWTYETAYVEPLGYKVATTNPDGTLNERILHRGSYPCSLCESGTFGFESVLVGMPYEESSYDASNPRKLLSRNLTTWTSKTFPTQGTGTPSWHPRVTSTESRIYDSAGNGLSTTTTLEYLGDLDLRETPVLATRTAQYGFVTVGSSTPANPLRVAETTYLIADSNYSAVKGYYTAQNMNGLVTASLVKDGAGNIVSRSETVFDESGRSPGYRGNPTTQKVWDSTKGAVTSSSAYIATSARFDAYGNQYEATDARGCATTTQFDGTYFAFPVQVTSCTPSDGTYGSNSAFVTTATFDTTTGLPLTTTDANGLETRITYDPVTLRPQNTKTYYNNVQVGSTAETIYHDEPGNYWVKNRAQIDANKWGESITYFDGLGRAWKTEEVNSNGNIFVEKEFDADGRVSRVSNPFRAGETKVWTTNVYDEASRVKEVILQDGAKIITDYGVSTSGVVGVTKQITDQAGKKRKGITDALGRMVRVIEDPTGQNLSTDYVFDTLGNLRKTIQGEQNRFFMHDSLGRLLFAKQPEQDTNANFVATDPVTGNTAWSVKYLYDDNGNITSTTDARNLSITATYDNLNRLKVRDYSDVNTPDVSFYYDGKGLGSVPARSNGKTTKVTSTVSETRYTSFDELGRLLTHEQRTPFDVTETIATATPRTTSYQYNLSGGLIKETYPSGREVNHEVNADGDLSRVWGQKGSAIRTYANAFNYNVSGAIESMRLGNGRWETAQYNSRQQTTQIGLGTGANAANVLKLEYGYGTSTQNNGNLREQKITVPNAGSTSGFTATQTYTYDDLNRLLGAEEKISNTTTWKQTFTMDRYGNRRYDAANTTTLGSCTQAICNPTISTTNNRFSTGQGYGYDQNGNVTQDAEGKRFGYDAENHQKEFFAAGNNSSTPDATYLYDGEGRRIKKISATETTVFVYNASGQLVAEYSTQTSSTPQISYLTTDHLGSTRLVTDQLGAVKDRKDFGAFGDETLTAARVGGLGYNAADPTRKNYTGYEKDGESGLEFAQARYYSSTHGRYTSVDPLTASASIRNPQTFNRYSYVLNSPYKYTDPLGLLPERRGYRDSTGTCGAEHSSCFDDWGPTWSEPEPVPEHQPTDEGVAANHEAMHNLAPEADEPEPPPPPTAEQNADYLDDLSRPSGPSSDLMAESPTTDTLRGPFVVPKEVVDDLVAGKLPCQGDGSCAKLPQILLGGQMGLTREWVAGQHITDFVDGPERGTVIATMDENRRYPNENTGNHVAIFLNFVYSPDGRVSGMSVVNQWIGLQKPKVSTIRLPPSNTPLPKVPSKAAISDMRTYWVVYRRVRQ